MRLGVNLTVFVVTLLIVASAFGANPKGRGKRHKRDTSASTRPAIVVAVVNLKVDSDKDNVQGKIEELSEKLREKVEEEATGFQVVSSRQMRTISRRHKKAIESCYDDCDVEFGLLAKANFVIGGHLEPSTSGIIGTMEIRNTQSRSVVSTKKVSGSNYFEFESALLSSVRRFVRPLNHVVFQAKDDESYQNETAAGTSTENEDVTGLGTTSDTVASGPSSQQESDFIAKQEEEKKDEGSSELDILWEDAKEEPPFLKEADLGFDQPNAPGMFGVGINAGYSFNVSRARHLRHLYTPVFHLGAQLQARIHHLFEIALVADIDYLTGGDWADKRFGTANMDIPTDDRSALLDVDRVNIYENGAYFTVGIRPTARLIIPAKLLEFFVGVGLGFNYVKTSGYWLTEATAQQISERDPGVPATTVTEHVPYNFTKSSIGFYGLFEAAVIVRAFSDRLGVGALFQFKMPSMWRAGSKTNVTIDPSANVSDWYGEKSAFGLPQESDVKNSPIGHVDALNLMTVGLIADWRF